MRRRRPSLFELKTEIGRLGQRSSDLISAQIAAQDAIRGVDADYAWRVPQINEEMKQRTIEIQVSARARQKMQKDLYRGKYSR